MRDARGNSIVIGDVMNSIAHPYRQVRLVAENDSHLFLRPENWLHDVPDDDGLIRVRRRVFERVGCWAMTGANP